jgi:hypothetical protein
MDIFISYSHCDKAPAEKLFRLLKVNWDVWMDHRIENGKYWKGAIDENLNAAALAIVLVSPDAMKSAYVTYEWCYKWFKWDKDINDLYFIRLADFDIDDEGMFGRIRADLQVPAKIVNSDESWNEVVKDIDERLSIFKEMQRNRAVLIDRHQGETSVFEAIAYLKQVSHFRRKACEFLIDGMRAQYTGMGTVVADIADALSRVGDLRALPCLWEVQSKTNYADAVRKANNAIDEICRRGV